MVIEHDHVHPALLQPGDGGNGGRAAVHRQQQRDWKSFQAILHCLLAQPVAFIQPMRQITMGGPSEPAQDLQQQGRRSHSVHVVIAEDHQRLLALTRSEEPVHGCRHVWKQQRIGQVLEPGLEEVADGRGFTQPAIQKALR